MAVVYGASNSKDGQERRIKAQTKGIDAMLKLQAIRRESASVSKEMISEIAR